VRGGQLTTSRASATLSRPEGEYPLTRAIVRTTEVAPSGGSGRPASRPAGETFGLPVRRPPVAAAVLRDG
jgi:hypothetical protein